MPTRISVSTIIVLAAVTWAAALWILGIDLQLDYIKPFTATVAVVTALLALFNRLLWRAKPFCWFHWVPDLNGTWKVRLQSTYIDPQTDQMSPSVEGEAVIKQTFSTLSIRIKTKSMDSFLLAERLVRHGDGIYDIFGVYQSDPHISLRGIKSEIHYGAFRYRLYGNPPERMTGHYWTDRNTKGSIELTK